MCQIKTIIHVRNVIDKKKQGPLHFEEGQKIAVPTGFEPAISALTGQHVKPLHHGTH